MISSPYSADVSHRCRVQPVWTNAVEANEDVHLIPDSLSPCCRLLSVFRRATVGPGFFSWSRSLLKDAANVLPQCERVCLVRVVVLFVSMCWCVCVCERGLMMTFFLRPASLKTCSFMAIGWQLLRCQFVSPFSNFPLRGIRPRTCECLAVDWSHLRDHMRCSCYTKHSHGRFCRLQSDIGFSIGNSRDTMCKFTAAHDKSPAWQIAAAR